MRHLTTLALAAALFAACRGASPDPAAMALDLPEPATLSGAAQQDVRITADRAVEALDAGRMEGAEELARQALDRDPACARARAVLANCLFARAGRTQPPELHLQQEADGETLRAVALAPKEPVVVRLRGVFLAATMHLSAAAEAAESLLAQPPAALDQEWLDLFRAAGMWRFRLGEERAAREWLRIAVQSPVDAEACFTYGLCMLRTAQVAVDATTAAWAFREASGLDPAKVEATYGIHRAYARAAVLARKAGESTQADGFLQSALDAAADTAAARATDPEPEFDAGNMLAEAGRADAAAAAWERALVRDPRHIGALLNLAHLRAPTDKAAAAALLQRALAAAGEDRTKLSDDERRRIAAFLQS